MVNTLCTRISHFFFHKCMLIWKSCKNISHENCACIHGITLISNAVRVSHSLHPLGNSIPKQEANEVGFNS